MPRSYIYALTMAIIDTIKEWLSRPCKCCGRKLINKDCYTTDCVEYYGGVKATREYKLNRLGIK